MMRHSDSQLAPGVTVCVEIVPFASAVYRVGGQPPEQVRPKAAMPRYAAPQTTNVEEVEITYRGNTFGVPKTSSGS